MKRRFQFSLASLLVATALVAVAIDWWTLRQRVVAARQEFEAEAASYEIGTTNLLAVTTASKELLQAELSMPLFPSDRVAWLSYLDRTRNQYRKQRWFAESAMFGSKQAWRDAHKWADELLQECLDVEDRFDLPHVDAEFFRMPESKPDDESPENYDRED